MCWVSLSSGYLWVRFSAGRGCQLALDHCQSSSLTGLCIINTLLHIQWSPLPKDTGPKFLMSTWLLRVVPRLLTRNSQWTRKASASEARLSLIQSCIFQTAFQESTNGLGSVLLSRCLNGSHDQISFGRSHLLGLEAYFFFPLRSISSSSGDWHKLWYTKG